MEEEREEILEKKISKEGQEPKKKTNRFSFSAISTFLKCPLSFYFKYMARLRTEGSAIHLDLGNIMHKGKELCSIALMAGEKPDYDAIREAVMKGWTGKNKTFVDEEESLMGVEEIQRVYARDWLKEEPGIPSYDERLETYFAHLMDDEKQEGWHPIAAEQTFVVPFEGVELFGTIDKIEENDQGQLRIVDYKSSKKPYAKAELTTPLQFYFYHLACKELFPEKEIVDYVYDFVALNIQCHAGTKGWLERAERKLKATLQAIRQCKTSGVWEPGPTPLCHWCDYCRDNPRAKEHRLMCDYYCLWKPDAKTYKTNAHWIPDMKAKSIVDAKKNNVFWF